MRGKDTEMAKNWGDYAALRNVSDRLKVHHFNSPSTLLVLIAPRNQDMAR
jgi:hypothetical protein